MLREPINLLPLSRVLAVRRDYFTRLAAVVTLALALLIFVGAILLVPSYLYLRNANMVSEDRVTQLATRLASADEQKVNTRLATLNENIQYLERLGTVSYATEAIRAVLAVDRTGITLTGFTFTPPSAGKQDGKMGVTGVAATRESLQTYDSLLAALPFVTSADLPISSYAKDSAIPFTITLSGSLTP